MGNTCRFSVLLKDRFGHLWYTKNRKIRLLTDYRFLLLYYTQSLNDYKKKHVMTTCYEESIEHFLAVEKENYNGK